MGANEVVPSTDTLRIALVKYSFGGTKLWTKVLPAARNSNQPRDLVVHDPNTYILFGVATNTDVPLSLGGGDKYLIMAIDSSANLLWRKLYNESAYTIDEATNIVRYRQNGYMFGGRYAADHPKILKTDVQGNVLLDSVLTSPALLSNDYTVSYGNFLLVSDGGVVFTGFNLGVASDLSDRQPLVSKVDTAFNVLWSVRHNEPGGSFSTTKVLELADSTLLLVTQNGHANRIILVKYSAQGQPLDTTYIPVTGATNALTLRNCFLEADGSLIYAGRTFMAKIGNVGLPMPQPQYPPLVGSPDELKAVAVLGLAYPNPAENTVTVPYKLPEGTTSAKLRIAEVATGRLVKEAVLDLNTQQLQIGLQSLSSGLYTYTLFLDGIPNATKKLVIIK